MRFVLPLALGLALAVGACAGGDPAKEYASLTANYNETYREVSGGLDAGSTLDEIRTALATMADAERAFGEGLKRIAFPVAVRLDVDELLRLTAQAETIAREGAAAADWETARSVLERYGYVSEQASAASNRIRLGLGLPGVVTPSPTATPGSVS